MATPVLTPLLTGLMSSGAGELLGAGIKVLQERAKAARENYQQTRVEADEPLAALRHQVISKINELRNRVALSVSDSELQQKVWVLLMEQTAEAYETHCERHLRLIEDNAAQIEAVLDSHQQAVDDRQKARAIAVRVSVFSLAGIGLFIVLAHRIGLHGEAAIPILGVPTCVLLWSVIGSFAAILYRFTNAGDRELEDPLRWLFSRPLSGVIMGAITFLVIRAGLLTMTPAAGAGPADKLVTNEVMWLIAFLAGFSDRFADGLLKSIAGRFGGDKTGDLIARQMNAQQPGNRILDQLMLLGSAARGSPAAHAAATAADAPAKPKPPVLSIVERPEAVAAPLTN